MTSYPDSTSVLFTDIPNEIVTTWSPLKRDDYQMQILRSITLTVNYSDFRSDTTPLKTCDSKSESTRLSEWKQAMKLYHEIQFTVESTIFDNPELYNSVPENARAHVRKQQWKNPDFSTRCEIYNLNQSLQPCHLLEPTESTHSSSSKTSSRRSRRH